MLCSQDVGVYCQSAELAPLYLLCPRVFQEVFYLFVLPTNLLCLRGRVKGDTGMDCPTIVRVWKLSERADLASTTSFQRCVIDDLYSLAAVCPAATICQDQALATVWQPLAVGTLLECLDALSAMSDLPNLAWWKIQAKVQAA